MRDAAVETQLYTVSFAVAFAAIAALLLFFGWLQWRYRHQHRNTRKPRPGRRIAARSRVRSKGGARRKP